LSWLVLATHVPPGGALGGVVRYTTELVSALGRRDDVRVTALATRAAHDDLVRAVGPRGQVRTLPPAPTLALSVWERYAPVRGRYDVVQGVKHLLPVRGPGVRVLTVHDMVLLDRPEDFSSLKRRLLPGPYRASLRDADVLVSVSLATQARLHALVPGTPGHSAVVPLATSPTLLNATPRPVAALAGRRFVVVVGDSSPRKNLGTLVDAWTAVRAVRPDAVLAVAGPPSWGRSEQGAAYDRLVTDGALVPLGRVADDELRWCYESAAVVACPSLAEGFGLPAAEALDLGAGVLVSDDAALQEIAGGRALRVVPAKDRQAWVEALVSALSLPHRRLAPPTQVRTWDDVAEDTVRAVRQAAVRR